MNEWVGEASQAWWMARVWAFGALVLALRYAVIAGGAFFVWYRVRRDRIFERKIQRRLPAGSDYAREVAYSFVSFGVFSAVGATIFATPLREYTQTYQEIAEYGWAYLGASLALMILIHDVYFYWAHRAMHHPRLFRAFHAVHHRSTNPSPWAAFAFHPLEAVVEASVIFVFVFLFPVHPLAVVSWLLFMTAYNVYGHLGWEVYGAGADRRGLLQWLNTSVSHNMHHQYARANYGLYFTWCDKLFGTVDPRYHEAYEEVARRTTPSTAAPSPARSEAV